MIFEIEFFGHENIRSNHKKTIEITKDSELTPSGDCIIGVNASHACIDLPDALKEELCNPNSKISFTFTVKPYYFTVNGNGHDGLTLSHKKDIVLRRSNFVCSRTMAVGCNKSSDLVPREMIRLLQNPHTKGMLTLKID